MRTIITIYVLFILLNLEGQKDYKATFIFENAKGLTDTVWVVDTIDLPDSLLFLSKDDIDTNFSVFTSDICGTGRLISNRSPQYISKYVGKLNDSIAFFGFDIICKDFPLTIRWDSSFFQDTSRSNSYLYNNNYLDPCLKSYPDIPPFLLKNNNVYKLKSSAICAYIDTSIYNTGIINRLNIIIADFKSFIPISTNQIDQELFIYPNPTENFLYIDKNIQIHSIQIIDMNGTVKKSFSNTIIENRIDISDLNKGIYMLKIFDGFNYHIYKFIKK